MRNAKRTASEEQGSDEELEAADAPVEGGSPGIAPASDPNEAKAKITLAADMIVGSAKDEKSEEAPPARRYVVVGGPYRVAHGAQVFVLMHGRQLSEASHPIEFLKKQGVRLEPAPA